MRLLLYYVLFCIVVALFVMLHVLTYCVLFSFCLPLFTAIWVALKARTSAAKLLLISPASLPIWVLILKCFCKVQKCGRNAEVQKRLLGQNWTTAWNKKSSVDRPQSVSNLEKCRQTLQHQNQEKSKAYITRPKTSHMII